MQANTQSDWTVIRRLLALSWRYRLGCIKVFTYQLILLATMGVLVVRVVNNLLPPSLPNSF